MSELILTTDQQNAYEAFMSFIINPIEKVFVLKGYSGTGKSTLVRKLIDDLPKALQTMKLLGVDEDKRYSVALTATTNKAAENLASITNEEVKTIHSKLKLRVQTDFKKGTTKLMPFWGEDRVRNTILFIDEASYIDSQLLKYIFEGTIDCKTVFIGDPAQLLNVGCKKSPVFDGGFLTASLETVVRQAEGSPITDLATAFRGTVNTGEFFSFLPDGASVQYKDRPDFEQDIANEFTRPNWGYADSKVLAWTNKCVINYNHGISNLVTGDPSFNVGDYAICNSYVSKGRASIKTDALVLITGMEPCNHRGLDGYNYTLNHASKFFMPNSRAEWSELIKEAKHDSDFGLVQELSNQWIDLRAAYSCTINKAQGSTYDKVFIDLDDIKKCRDPNQLARMLYVGVSRARSNVIMTGDLI